MKCRVCGGELRTNNKSGVHTKCMTPSERFERSDERTKRSTNGEQGDPDQWREAARALLGVSTQDADLMLFGFTRLPTLLELRRRYKAMMFDCHPDRGGESTMAAKVNEAYNNLRKQIKI